MHLKIKLTFLAVISLVGLLGGGCAFSDNEIDFNYAAMSNSPLREIPATRVMISVTDARPADQRQSIGEVKNTYGMHTADVLTKEPITLEIYQALAAEFRAAGHQVVNSDREAPQVRIDVQLMKINVDHVMHFWDIELTAEITTNVAVYNPPANQQAVSLLVNGTSTESAAVVTESTREKALNNALTEYVRSLIFNDTFIKSLRSPNPPPVTKG